MKPSYLKLKNVLGVCSSFITCLYITLGVYALWQNNVCREF
jgi:hypothetical protein